MNALLQHLNLKFETLTSDRREMERLQALEKEGYFDRPIVPVLKGFRQCDSDRILEAVCRNAKDFAKVAQGVGCTSFELKNDYYTSPDAEILYSLTRMLKPKKIIEVGAGNSTLLFREAIHDERIATELVSIDPFPRREIRKFTDRFLKARLESPEAKNELLTLEPGDFLFIDSSHEVKTGNDVMELFLNILPRLKPGVMIHIHDIFLPYEYPKEWIIKNRWPWNEQYLVQALLQGSEELQVLWAGHYRQKTMPDFVKHFPLWLGKDASSLWLRKT